MLTVSRSEGALSFFKMSFGVDHFSCFFAIFALFWC